MKHVIAMLLVTVALAGCASEEPVDPASLCDEETHFIDAAGECTPHTMPSLTVSGLPGSVEQYQAVPFDWTLDPGTFDAVHSMDSRVLGSFDNAAATNATGPDDWGTELARAEHKDLPQNLTGTFQWEEVGMVYLKGYMLIDGAHTWFDLGTIDVAQISATGNYTEITVSAFTAGGAPSLSETSTTVIVGNGVTFTNNNEAVGYTITFDGDDCPSGGALPAGGSASFDFLAPASCDYTLASDLSGAGVTQGDLEGRVNANAP